MKDLSQDIGEEIIFKLKEIISELNFLLTKNEKEFSDSYTVRNWT